MLTAVERDARPDSRQVSSNPMVFTEGMLNLATYNVEIDAQSAVECRENIQLADTAKGDAASNESRFGKVVSKDGRVETVFAKVAREFFGWNGFPSYY